MKKRYLSLALILELLARPFVGRGIIDRHLPFLIPFYQKLYFHFQTQTVSTVNIPLGLKLMVFIHDLGIGLPLITRGVYESTETKLFLEIVKTGDVVMDIGANVGYYTLLASKKVGKTGKIIAFEVDRKTLKLLKKNIELNNLENVIVEEKAVSNKTNKLMFFSSINAGESGIAYKGVLNGYEVNGITLDSYIRSADIRKIDVLKIDIEGAETLVLESATFLKKFPGLKMLIEYNPEALKRYTKNPFKLFDQIKNLGFKIESIINERDGIIIPYSPMQLKKTLSRVTYCNLYCIQKAL